MSAIPASSVSLKTMADGTLRISLPVLKWRSAQGLPALNTTSHFIVKKERLMSDSNSTTKFCKKCQANTERGSGGCCKPCLNIRKRAYRAAHYDRLKITTAAWVAANPEKQKAYRKKYLAAHPGRENARVAAARAAHPEKHRAAVAAHRAAFPEKNKASRAAWRAANPEKAKAATRAWREANPESSKLACLNYRARKNNNGGVLSKDISTRLFKLQRGKCPCCNLSLGEDYHLDHKMPLILGGLNSDENMQLLRATCNLKKNKKHPIDYMQSKGFLL